MVDTEGSDPSVSRSLAIGDLARPRPTSALAWGLVRQHRFVMPRHIRITYAGAHYHVTDRGNHKADIFLCDRDRRLFLKRLGEACLDHSLRCLAYCLMSNHYHLLLRADGPGLSKGMQSLNARYAEHFNRACDQTGHVFQGRFRADIIETERYLMEAMRYIELNPVRAGLSARASDWDWNSYGAILGHRTHAAWFDRGSVLSLFAIDPHIAAACFSDFIAEGDPNEPLANTSTRRTRAYRDHAIREAYSTDECSIGGLASEFGVSRKTILRALGLGHGRV